MMKFTKRRNFLLGVFVPLVVIALLTASSFYGLSNNFASSGPAATTGSSSSSTSQSQKNQTASAPQQDTSGIAYSTILIQSHQVTSSNAVTYMTDFGNYTFYDSAPWIVSFTDRAGQILSPESMFTLNESGIKASSPHIVTETDSIFSVQYELWTSMLLGNMTVTYNFDFKPVNNIPLEPKITAKFSPAGPGTYSVSWMVVPAGHYIAGAAKSSSKAITRIGGTSLQLGDGYGKSGSLLVGPTNQQAQWATAQPGGVLKISWTDSGLTPSLAAGVFVPTSSESLLASVFPQGIQMIFPAGSYTIDPTLTSTTGQGAVDGSSQRKTFYSDGLFWAFYATDGWIEYSTSVNGSIFSAPTNTSIAAQNGKSFSVYNNNASFMYLVVANFAQSGFYEKGALDNNGTIIWSAKHQFIGSSGDILSSPTVSLDSSGNVFVTVFSANNAGPTNIIFENGAELQVLNATSMSGILLGNGNFTSAVESGVYSMGAGFTSPITATPAVNGLGDAFITISMRIINDGTEYYGVYNSSGNVMYNGTFSITSNTINCGNYLAPIPSTLTFEAGQKYYFVFYTMTNGANSQNYYCAASSSGGLVSNDQYGGSTGPLQKINTGAFGSGPLYNVEIGLASSSHSEYQTPIALPTGPEQSYFLYGDANGLQGESFNSSGSAVSSAHLVQQANSTIYSQNGNSATSLSFSSNVTSGNGLVVATGTNPCQVASVSDSQGNIYSVISSIDVGNGVVEAASVWYATATSSAVDTVSVSITCGSGTTGDVNIFEVSGIQSQGAIAETGYGTSSTTTSVSSFTPFFKGFVVAASYYDLATPSSAGQYYTLAPHSSPYQGYTEYNASWTGASTTAPFVLSSDSYWAEVAVSFPLDQFSSDGTIGANLTAGDNVASAVPLNGKIYLAYLQTDTNGLYSIIYKSYSGTAWSSPTIIQSGIAYPVHPAVSVNNGTGDVYVFWAGYPQLNNVYYDFYNSTSSSWSPVVQWLNATDFTPSDGMGYSNPGSFQTISVSPYASKGKIGAIYETGLSSPHEIQYSVLVDPPSVSAVDAYNAIQGAQDYLTRLERNTNGISVLSEYPALPLTLKYSDGCYEVGQQGGAQPESGCAFGGPSSISAVSVSETSNIFDYYFYSPKDSTCAGVANSPVLSVTETFEGFKGNGPVFQYTVNMTLLQFSDTSSGCTFSIYLGPHLLGSGINSADLYNEFSWVGNIMTYPRGGGGINYGLDMSFNPFSAPGVVSTLALDSFRYTPTSGLQSELKWSTASVQPIWNQTAYAETLSPQVSNELSSTAVPYTIQDPYTPQWLYGQNLPWSFEDNASTSGGPYTDCNTGQTDVYVGYNAVFGFAYPYTSAICSYGVSNYLSKVWGNDPLIMSETAIQVLDKFGPYDQVIPWNGSIISPAAFANNIVNSGWFNSTYGISYPYICGNYLCPNATQFSATRTAAFGELLTLLGYKYGYTQFQSNADSMINALVKAQWGMGCPANCINEGSRVPVGGGNTMQYGGIFRPQDTGGMEIAWTTNFYEVTPPNSTGLAGALNDINNMASEYAGPIITDQEATQAALAAFETYYNLALAPINPQVNYGVQPFFNTVFQNTGNTVVNREVSSLGIYPSQTFNMTFVAVNEGDPVNRVATVYLNGVFYAKLNLTGSSVDTVQTFTFGLGVLNARSIYTVGISLNTTDPTTSYAAPRYWWLVSASIYGIPATTKVVNSSSEYYIPPPTDDTFYLTVSPVTLSGIPGAQGNATNYANESVSAYMYFQVTNSQGQVVSLASVNLYSVAYLHSAIAAYAVNLPAGTYTYTVFVWTYDGVAVSNPESISVTT